MSGIRLLHPHQYQRTRWKNNGGWTTEITRSDDASVPCGFRWRVSIAEIETDGPFSSFPGVDRDLLLLTGNGMELDINDAPAVHMDRRLQHIRFAGEDSVMCRLLAGPTRDFNVMADRQRCKAEVHARPLIGTMLLFVDPGSSWLVHALSGSATLRSDANESSASSGDTLLIETGDVARQRMVIEGSGELILVKFSPATMRTFEYPDSLLPSA